MQTCKIILGVQKLFFLNFRCTKIHYKLRGDFVENLLIESEETSFNLDEIKQRGLVRAQYHSWNEPRNGIVVAVSEKILQILFLPLIRTSAQYFKIKASEIVEGKWSIIYTNDFENFFSVEMTFGNEENISEEITEEIIGDNSDW